MYAVSGNKKEAARDDRPRSGFGSDTRAVPIYGYVFQNGRHTADLEKDFAAVKK